MGSRSDASASGTLAPGARVVIRNEEWIVRRVDRLAGGHRALHVTGVSELTRGKEAIFLEQLESRIQVLAPEDTALVADPSPHYRQSKLYIESLLQRYIPPLQEQPRLYLGHRAAMNVLPFQLQPALQALEQPRQRILIADAVGLGKTLECGILLSELMRRGRGQRILVLAMKSILTQFQKEMWSRFSIPLIRLDSDGIRRIRQQIPSNHNPFDYHDKIIISIDTLKRDSEYRRYLEQARWDIIVIDEAHNVADRSGVKDFYGLTRSQALRTRLARLLATRSDTLIMLSATPHDGRAQSFASLMNMLNPTAIANPHDYRPEDIKGLFVRRFKKDILNEVGEAFLPRRIEELHAPATAPEEAAFEALLALRRPASDASTAPTTAPALDQRSASIGELAAESTSESSQSGSRMLFATTLEKALFSSPAACLETVSKRHAALTRAGEGETPEAQALARLQDALQAIGPEHFSRYQLLLQLIQQQLAWQPRSDDRLVIFTERIATLHFLQQHLPPALGLKPEAVEILHGGLSDLEQQRVVEAFGKESAPVRLLLASDVAAEGINLHYLSHRMIHFDIPWSLMTFQQRNGRIDRYGQPFAPEIYYLMTDSALPAIRGDQRILSLLIQKDQMAIENIGDPSALMGAYNVEAEEALTASAIEQGLSPEAFEAQSLQADPAASLEALLADWQAISSTPQAEAALPPEQRTARLPSLYPRLLDYVQAAFDQLQISDYELHPDQQGLTLNLTPDQLPPDLRVRFRALPRELLRKDSGLRFSADTARIQADIARCRKEENAWPEWHYLWEQHPLIDWLSDRVTAQLGRHQAPVIALPTLAAGESVYWLSGLYPSENGHPIIWEWPGVCFSGDRYLKTLNLHDTLAHTGFAERPYANPAVPFDAPALQARLPRAVQAARNWLEIQREDFAARFAPRLQQELQALDSLKNRQLTQLAQDYPEASGALLRERDQRERRILRVFDDYTRWVRESMSVAAEPYVQLVAVFVGLE